MTEVIEMTFDSSAISKARYDAGSKNMNITFTSGGSYDYPSVPKEIALGMATAESAGKYFHKFIKPYAV